MTSLERYLAMLGGASVDHLPRIPILMRYAADLIEAPYDAYCTDYRVKCRGNLIACDRFGIDVVSVMSDPYSETAALGGEIVFHPAATPECPCPPVAGLCEVDRLPLPDPLASPRLLNTVHTVRAYADAFTAGLHEPRCNMGWVEGPAAEAADLRGVSRFLMDLIDDPERTGHLMDHCVGVAIEFAAAQREAGADTIGVGDAICSQVSPDLYESLILPRQQRLFEALGGIGAIRRLHICGNISHLLPGLATLPLEILDVDHMVDIETVRKAMPAHIALVANLDPVSQVMQSTPKRIRDAVKSCYHKAGRPFFAGAGCEVPPGTPEENLRALCEPVAV
ncbi:MAG: hypothetical protein GC164_07540 [Phycisphaera sp.]|nr:hypothetical protein [Phycisphaera sp.]